jgi:hypothetical protein
MRMLVVYGRHMSLHVIEICAKVVMAVVVVAGALAVGTGLLVGALIRQVRK